MTLTASLVGKVKSGLVARPGCRPSRVESKRLLRQWAFAIPDDLPGVRKSRMVPSYDGLADRRNRRPHHVPIVRAHCRPDAARSLRGLHWAGRQCHPARLQRLALDDQVRREFHRLDRRRPDALLAIADGALIFMLLSWEILNVATRIAGSSVSLNLGHAFEAGMAGYGLGRILKSRDSSEAQSAATPTTVSTVVDFSPLLIGDRFEARRNCLEKSRLCAANPSIIFRNSQVCIKEASVCENHQMSAQ